MHTLTVKKRHDERLRAGHAWVFSNELEHVPNDISAGELVRVQAANGKAYGTAFFHPHSLISARLLYASVDELSEEFFVERIGAASALRTRIFPRETSYRLVFGESDLLPGLIIDRYHDAATGDYFVLQTLSVGMDTRKDMICAALRLLFPNTQGIVEKNNSTLRKHDGLEMREGVLWGSVPPEITMTENGLRFSLSLLEGQKTGYFLDQKLNRRVISEIAGGLQVLDCFTNQGGFALHAAAGGAVSVLGLDSSQSAVERCRINTRLNGMDETTVRFECEEVFEFLQKERATMNLTGEQRWDMIILDPPAFAKSRKQVPPAKRGYAKINRAALALLPKGGFLASASCSHHISEETLWSVVREQAELEGRQLRLVFRGTQSPCHPVLVSMPETRYLKFFLFEVQ